MKLKFEFSLTKYRIIWKEDFESGNISFPTYEINCLTLFGFDIIWKGHSSIITSYKIMWWYWQRNHFSLDSIIWPLEAKLPKFWDSITSHPSTPDTWWNSDPFDNKKDFFEVFETVPRLSWMSLSIIHNDFQPPF